VDPALAKVIQAQLPPAAAGSGNQGYAVENSHQARINASGYQSSMDSAIMHHPEAGDVLRNIKMEKTIAGKKMIAAKAISANPALMNVIQDWMLNQGKA